MRRLLLRRILFVITISIITIITITIITFITISKGVPEVWAVRRRTAWPGPEPERPAAVGGIFSNIYIYIYT